MSRFQQVKWWLRHEPCDQLRLNRRLGRKLPSVRCVSDTSGNVCERLRYATPGTGTREVGPSRVSMWNGMAPRKRVVKNALASAHAVAAQMVGVQGLNSLIGRHSISPEHGSLLGFPVGFP